MVAASSVLYDLPENGDEARINYVKGKLVVVAWKFMLKYSCACYGGIDYSLFMETIRSFLLFFLQGDCWICMELMDTSLDKFYKFIYERMHERLPENMLGKITVAVSRCLN